MDNIIEVKDNQIIVEKVTPAVEEIRETFSYDLDFLLKQKEQVQSDYDRDAGTLAIRQAELDTVNNLIEKAKSMGATLPIEKPIEPTPVIDAQPLPEDILTP
jgi:hypothetical protein